MPDNELAPLVKMWRRYERYKAYCALLKRPALTFSDYRARIWSIAVSCLTSGRPRVRYSAAGNWFTAGNGGYYPAPLQTPQIARRGSMRGWMGARSQFDLGD